jgi:hypothetical protein
VSSICRVGHLLEGRYREPIGVALVTAQFHSVGTLSEVAARAPVVTVLGHLRNLRVDGRPEETVNRAVVPWGKICTILADPPRSREQFPHDIRRLHARGGKPDNSEISEFITSTAFTPAEGKPTQRAEPEVLPGCGCTT